MWELRPWDWHCSRWALELIKKIVKLYEKHNIKIFFRLDSWFAIPEIYEYLEQENIWYTIKLKSNSCITKIAEKLALEKKIKPWENKIFEFEYSAGSWKQRRRIICSLDWIEKETKESKKDKKNKKWAKQFSLFPNYSFIVTNDKKMSEQDILSLYNWRATVETCIEEAKNGFWINRLSHKKFEVNQAMFQVHLLAMQISQIFRKHTIAVKKNIEEETEKYTKQEHNWKFEWIKKVGRKMFSCPTIQTLRKTLLEIPTRVTFWHRKRIFNFERTFWGKDLYQKVMKKMQSIKI